MGSPWPGNVRFLILDHAMARAGFTAHRGHQRRHGAGRLQPWQELSPGRHRRYKAVLYKQNRRAASTKRRAIRIIRRVSKNRASPAALRIEDRTWCGCPLSGKACRARGIVLDPKRVVQSHKSQGRDERI
jgi:hypothetical protein